MAEASNEIKINHKNAIGIQSIQTFNQLSNTHSVTIKNKMLIKNLINTRNAQKNPQNTTNTVNKMTKVMNPLIKVTKPLTKVTYPQNKVTFPKDKGTNLLSIIKKKLQSLKNTDDEGKANSLQKVRENNSGEFHPQHCKRNLQPKKVRLHPQPNYRVVATTNKRKRHIPHKGLSSHILTPLASKLSEESLDSEMLPRVESPSLFQSHESPELSLAELVKLAEEEELDDEDFMEILTCPSPVWWEEDSVDEDDFDEDLEEEMTKQDTPSSDLNKGDASAGETVNNNKSTDAHLFKKFFTKRSKLENVLGNIKNKQIRIEDDVVINDVIFIEDNDNLNKNKDITEDDDYEDVKNDDNTEVKIINNNKELERIHNIKFTRNDNRNKQLKSVDNDDVKEIEIVDDYTKQLTSNDGYNEKLKLIIDHKEEHTINAKDNKGHNCKQYKNNSKFGNRKRKSRLGSLSNSINEDLLNNLESIEIPVQNIIGQERNKQETTQNIVMMEIVNKPIVNNEPNLTTNKRKRTRNPKYYNDSTLSGICKVNRVDKAIKEDTKQVDKIKHEDIPLDLPPLTKNPFKNAPKGFDSPKSIESGNSESSVCEDSISDTNIKFLDEYVADEAKLDSVNVKKYAKVNDGEFITVYQVVNGKSDSMDLDIEEHIKANLVNKSPQTEVNKNNGEIDSYYKPIKSFSRKSRATKKNC